MVNDGWQITAMMMIMMMAMMKMLIVDERKRNRTRSRNRNRCRKGEIGGGKNEVGGRRARGELSLGETRLGKHHLTKPIPIHLLPPRHPDSFPHSLEPKTGPLQTRTVFRYRAEPYSVTKSFLAGYFREFHQKADPSRASPYSVTKKVTEPHRIPLQKL